MIEYIKLTRQSYDKDVKLWAAVCENFNLERPYLKFLEYLHKKDLVLDVGCGIGSDPYYFLTQGLKVIGIDFSGRMLREARKMAPQGDFIEMDMRRLGLGDSIFDGLWAYASLCHIPKKEIGKVLHNFYRILKPNGIIYANFIEGKGEIIINNVLYTYFEKSKLKLLFEEKNFKILNSYIEKGQLFDWIHLFAEVIK